MSFAVRCKPMSIQVKSINPEIGVERLGRVYPCHSLAHKIALLSFCEVSCVMYCAPVTIFHLFFAVTHFSLSLALIVLTFTLD